MLTNLIGSKLPQEIRSFISLIASIIGSAVFTVLTAWLVWIMWKGGWAPETAPERIDVIGRAMMLSLAGTLVIVISLGFAINRRTIKLGAGGFEASGGEDDNTVTATAQATVVIPQGQSVDEGNGPARS